MVLQLITKSAEVKLMEALHDMQQAYRWKAMHFHLEKLQEQYQSEYQVKIAINLIHDLLRDRDGGIYLLLDHGLIILCSDLEQSIQSKLIFQLRYLYMDDPLAYHEDGQENTAFCEAYDLSANWQAFFDLVTRKMARTVRKSAAMPMAPASQSVAVAQPVLSQAAAKHVSSLSEIEEDIAKADIAKLLRRQPVCAARPHSPIRRVFDEIYIHIPQLKQMVDVDTDFFANRWLFKYVTQLLDQRMIQNVRDNASRFLESPISLNLNVETLLSSWFNELDAAIPAAAKVSVVIEVPVVDAFADITGFHIAREEVQRLGYRLCLDGLTTRSFIQIDRGKLGADLIKLQWNADVLGDLRNMQSQELSEAIQMAGTNRVILCRCDNRQAVEYGQALGIPLFQGRYIDSLVNPLSKVEN